MKFTETHEWIQVNGDIGTVGITEHAQKELGEVVYVELPAVGKQAKAGQEIAVLESTKAAADIYSPVSGEIVEVNQMPPINSSPEKEGWLFKIKLSDPDDLKSLLDRKQYLELVK